VRLTAVLVSSLALLASASTSAADQPRTYLARNCSQTDDLCYGIFKLEARDRIVFQITTQARYFASYRICVKAPTGSVKCRNFPLNRQTPLSYGNLVYWRRYFGERGPGVYRVTWKDQQGTRLGPTVSFTRR
jgi:hypothetical protein